MSAAANGLMQAPSTVLGGASNLAGGVAQGFGGAASLLRPSHGAPQPPPVTGPAAPQNTDAVDKILEALDNLRGLSGGSGRDAGSAMDAARRGDAYAPGLGAQPQPLTSRYKAWQDLLQAMQTRAKTP